MQAMLLQCIGRFLENAHVPLPSDLDNMKPNVKLGKYKKCPNQCIQVKKKQYHSVLFIENQAFRPPPQFAEHFVRNVWFMYRTFM
jgi:hypothetical protein